MEKKFKLMIFGFLVLALVPNIVTPSYATSQLYGIAGTGGGTSSVSTFYTIDSSTGTATSVGLVGFLGCDAMEVEDSGIIYATCNRPGTDINVLVTIDPLTGVGTEVGPTGVVNDGCGLNVGPKDVSFRNSDGVLFGYTHTASGFNLMTIDLVTGLATPIGSGISCNSGNGLSFTPGDTLLVKDELTLYEVDQVTGVLSNPILTADFATAIDYNPDDGLQYAAEGGGGGGAFTRDLVTIDPLTGVSTLVGPTVDRLTAIAFAPMAVAVGGSDVAINTSALLLAGVQSISMWMIPVVVAGIGIGVFVIKRRN